MSIEEQNEEINHICDYDELVSKCKLLNKEAND